MNISELIRKAISEGQFSFEDQIDEVGSAFFQSGVGEVDDLGWVYPVQTYADRIVIAAGQQFFRVGYQRDGDEFAFDDQADWVPVQSEWTIATAPDRTLTEGNALKAISMTDTELRVGNYMVLFGGRDLEGIASPRVNGDGSLGEFFTKATAFGSPYTELDMVAIDWEHGAAPADEPQKDDLLGRVDWKTAQVDEKGLFVERVLNRRNRYVKFLEELIDEGMIGTSSEPVQKSTKTAKNGEIIKWPIMRDSLTVSPMEPRMLGENTLAALKALSQRLPALKSYIGSPDEKAKATQPEAGRTPAAVVADKSDAAKRLSIELELLELCL